MPIISNKNNKSTTTVKNLNNVAPNANCDGKVKTNLYATPNITQRGNITAMDNYGSAYATDIPNVTVNATETAQVPPTLYRCSVCGVIHEGGDTAPKNCVKCDNDRFYKVK